MKIKNSILLLVLATILMGIIFHLKSSNYLFTIGQGEKFIADLPVERIAKITLKEGATAVTIVKHNNAWQVVERKNYAANSNLVRDFLFTLSESKIMRTIKIDDENYLSHLKLLDNGTNVTLYDEANNPITSFILGVNHFVKAEDEVYTRNRLDAVGIYAKNLAVENAPVSLLNDSFEIFVANPIIWLDPFFISFANQINSVSVRFKNEADNWDLVTNADNSNMTLLNCPENYTVNMNLMRKIYPFFSELAIADVEVDKNIINLLEQKAIITITDIDGIKYEFFVYNAINDNYICQVKTSCLATASKEISQRVEKYSTLSNNYYQIPGKLINPFLVSHKEFLQKKP